MTPNDSGPQRPTDDAQPTKYLADAQGHLEGDLRDALATITDGVRTGTFDVEDLARFRQSLGELDILVEDALEAEGEIDVDETPALLAQDQARQLFSLTAQLATSPTTSAFTKAYEHYHRAGDALDDLKAATVGTRAPDVDAEENTEAKLAAPSVTIDDGPVAVDQYPGVMYDDVEGELFMWGSRGDVAVGANAEGDGWQAGAMLEFDPDTAEWVAAVLLECAAKARAGEEWYHNA